jgi:hypothetical protein
LDPKALDLDYQETISRKGTISPAYSVFKRPITFSFLVLAITHLAGMMILYVIQPNVASLLQESFGDQVCDREVSVRMPHLLTPSLMHRRL